MKDWSSPYGYELTLLKLEDKHTDHYNRTITPMSPYTYHD